MKTWYNDNDPFAVEKLKKAIALGRQVWSITGLTMTCAGVESPVQVESGAALNPEHSRWLQGFTKGWAGSGCGGTR